MELKESGRPSVMKYRQRGLNSQVNAKVNSEAGLLEELNIELQKLLKFSEEFDNQVPSSTEITFTELLTNKLLIVKIIKRGIPFSMFAVIQKMTPFSFNDWAGYLDVSQKSLTRYRHEDKVFKSILSEKIIEIAEVTYLGLEVFGDNQKFRLWLETPCFALGKTKPSELLKDSYGKELIISELTKIHHGIFA